MMHRIGLRAAAASAALGVAMGGSVLKLDVEDDNLEIFYSRFVRPALKLVDPESAHRAGVLAGRFGLLPQQKRPDPGVLQTHLWGHVVDNPIGLAAGFDKDGEAIGNLLSMGFGSVEVGSITPKPQPGNPRPRVFRLEEDRAVINRYGFNSCGHDAAVARLSLAAKTIPAGRLLGINLGKNKTSEDAAADYCAGVRSLGPFAGYLVINVSSPNTPGLRNLQGREELSHLLREVRKEVDNLPHPQPPLVLKMSPDVDKSECADIAEVALKARVDGIIVSNTTISRPESLKSKLKDEIGGLSGAPLMSRSTAVLQEMYKLTEGKITLIGVGGIDSGADAYEKIRAGASAVQLYTSLVYEGPTLVARIKRELAELLEKDGYVSVQDAVGADTRLTRKKSWWSFMR